MIFVSLSLHSVFLSISEPDISKLSHIGNEATLAEPNNSTLVQSVTALLPFSMMVDRLRLIIKKRGIADDKKSSMSK